MENKNKIYKAFGNGLISLDDIINMSYNQALEDFVMALKNESSKEWEQFDNWYEFADCIKNKLMKNESKEEIEVNLD